MTDWKIITSEKDVNEIVAASGTKPQVIFKHSISCGISAQVKDMLDEELHLLAGADVHYLDLLRYRSVSNYIAQHLKVTHQSPQILVLKNGQVVYHGSHFSINTKKIVEKL